jgi:hypothetical protein
MCEVTATVMPSAVKWVIRVNAKASRGRCECVWGRGEDGEKGTSDGEKIKWVPVHEQKTVRGGEKNNVGEKNGSAHSIVIEPVVGVAQRCESRQWPEGGWLEVQRTESATVIWEVVCVDVGNDHRSQLITDGAIVAEDVTERVDGGVPAVDDGKRVNKQRVVVSAGRETTKESSWGEMHSTSGE